MHIPGRGAFGAAARVQCAAKTHPSKEPSTGIRYQTSLQDHWETAANSFDKKAQGDDSSLPPQTTPKALGMSDAMRPPACQLEGKHWWCLKHEWEGRTRGRQMPHHMLFPNQLHPADYSIKLN